MSGLVSSQCVAKSPRSSALGTKREKFTEGASNAERKIDFNRYNKMLFLKFAGMKPGYQGGWPAGQGGSGLMPETLGELCNGCSQGLWASVF